VIIQGKREIAHNAPGVKFISLGACGKVVEVFYDGVIADVLYVIPLEGALKCIGIGEEPENDHQKDMDEPFLQEPFVPRASRRTETPSRNCSILSGKTLLLSRSFTH
jgi:hypothetical protein